DGVSSFVDDAESTGHTRKREPRTTTEWAWLAGFVLAIVVILVAGFLVARSGVRTILASTDGDVTNNVNDPGAPGYRLIVESSPTTALGIIVDGRLVSAALIVPSADAAGGTWLIVPAETVVDGGDRLADLWAASGNEALREPLADLVGVEPDSFEVLDELRFETLVDPTGPVELTLADDLFAATDAGPEVRFGSGRVVLDPDEFATFLAWQNPGESPANRVSRQRDALSAWLAAESVEPESPAIAGDLATTIATLAGGTAVVETIPLVGTNGTNDRFEVDVDAVRERVLEIAPFARAATSVTRPLTLVLNSTNNDQALTLAVATLAGSAGAQVTALGNGDDFLADSSTIRYVDETWADAARQIAETLGIDLVELDVAGNPAFDLTLVIGPDLAARAG
ncbi:MAG: LytR C-terminal domain-containing protein, partial [Acidimicrobiia bacterium]|nr:LytR C-terminal domain-containing protein [Acidimicrobiia bacterium]